MTQLMTVMMQLMAAPGGDLMDIISYVISIAGGIILAVLALKIASRVLKLVFSLALLVVLAYVVLKFMGVDLFQVLGM